MNEGISINIADCHWLVKICPHITICGRKIKDSLKGYEYSHQIEMHCKCCKNIYYIHVYQERSAL